MVTKVPFSLGVDTDGNYGYYKDGADSVTPFSGKVYIFTESITPTEATNWNGWSVNLTGIPGYQKLTTENMIATLNNTYIRANNNGDINRLIPTITWNSSTGIARLGTSIVGAMSGYGATYYLFVFPNEKPEITYVD